MSSDNPEIVNSANPWPGLSSFTESNREYFHGREEETAELFRLVKRETMTVLFGQSGIGKTSLLNAGLFPLLRSEQFLPVYVRLGFDDNNEPLVEQVKRELQTACAREGIEAPPFKTSEGLWEYFHRTDADFWNRRNKLITPVLIFDRFEAMFTLGSLTQTIRSRCDELILQLSDLVRNHCPAHVQALFDADPTLMRLYDFDKENFKIILSLREDFLANLEDLQNELPVKKNRLRLRQMNGVRARDAIINVGGHLIEDGLAERIVRFVAGSSGDSPASSATRSLGLLDIEPALLSIVCRELNNKRIQKGLEKITAGLLSGSSKQILEDFYDRGLLGIKPEVKNFIEDRLLTVSGVRTTVSLDDALQTAGISRNDIDILVNRRILRFEDRFGARHLELIHDRLTEVVKNQRDQRRGREAAEQADRERREALRKMREKQRRQLTLIVTFAVAAILSMGFAVYGFWQKHKAETLANKSFELLKTFMPDGTTKVYEYFRTCAIESYKEGAYGNAITHLKSANLSPDMPATNDLAGWKDTIDTYQRLGQQADKELEKRSFTEAQKLCEQILAGNKDSRADTSRLSLCKLFTEQLILVRGGSFNMGSKDGGQVTMLHKVSLDSFYISRFEITNAQYAHFLNQYGSDKVKSGDYEGLTMVDKLAWGVTSQGQVWFPQPGYEDYPVVGVSWYGANEFCRFYGGSLPTEAQWEYAATSGGKEETWSGTSDENALGEYAWYDKNSERRTHKVGTRNPNGLGIYDMSGNVWEWCSDWAVGDYYQNSPKDNPPGPASGSYRVFRGGGWCYTAEYLRASDRHGGIPADRGNSLGFRLARTP